MNQILVAVGVRGAGKTTLLRSLKGTRTLKVLRPGTTRPRREDEEDDCQSFSAEEFDERLWLWSIEIGQNRYGLEVSEAESVASGQIGLTVFDPGNISALERARSKYPDYDFITVGLDTIENLAQQKARVAGDTSRIMSPVDFDAQRDVVRKADVVLRGDPEKVRAATLAIVDVLLGRGVVSGVSLRPLIDASVLLTGTQSEMLKSASYDLRLGDQYAIGGKVKKMAADHPVMEIPAHSYVLAECKEQARLPTFIVGRFDLRVSLFLKGIMLSNGPQVDPGYHGLFFCLLFNAGSKPVSVKVGEHLATIEFSGTSRRCEPYGGEYKNFHSLAAAMPADALAGTLPDLQQRVRALETDRRRGLLPLYALAIGASALVLTMAIAANNSSNEARKTLNEVRSELNDVQSTRRNSAVDASTTSGGPSAPDRMESAALADRNHPSEMGRASASTSVGSGSPAAPDAAPEAQSAAPQSSYSARHR
jgi:deoxycytidine triphosphate deaminase